MKLCQDVFIRFFRQLLWLVNCAARYTCVCLPVLSTSKGSWLWWLRSIGRSRKWWVSTASMLTSFSGYVLFQGFAACLCLYAGTVKMGMCCLQELQIFSMRLEEVSLRIPIPREVYVILWQNIFHLTCNTFVEGWVCVVFSLWATTTLWRHIRSMEVENILWQCESAFAVTVYGPAVDFCVW